MELSGIIYFVSEPRKIINRDYRILWPTINVSQKYKNLYQLLINKFPEEQQTQIDNFIENYLSLFENTQYSENESILILNDIEQFPIVLERLNDLQQNIKAEISLSLDEIERIKNHQNEFSLVFDNTSSEKSVLFLSDIDKDNFENNIKSEIKDSYWAIKIAHHGTNRYFSNQLPNSEYKIISNSIYKNSSWGISKEYPSQFESKFICTNNNNCQYYINNGKCCLNSFKCGINHSFLKVIF